MEVKGLEGKAFEFTIKWVVDTDYVFDEGTLTYLETLREVGSAEITETKIIERES